MGRDASMVSAEGSRSGPSLDTLIGLPSVLEAQKRVLGLKSFGQARDVEEAPEGGFHRRRRLVPEPGTAFNVRKEQSDSPRGQTHNRILPVPCRRRDALKPIGGGSFKPERLADGAPGLHAQTWRHTCRMDQESLRALLQRAEEIQEQRNVDLSWSATEKEILAAAEEAGLDRTAVEQALRERLSLESKALQPGELVYVPTPDGYHRIATVLSTDENAVDVRFLSGSDHHVNRSDIRPFSLLPGQRIQAPWPNWGWWTCTVVSYDRDLKMGRLSDGWSEERFSLADLRADFRPQTPAAKRLAALKWKLAYALGGVVGSALALLIWRLFFF